MEILKIIAEIAQDWNSVYIEKGDIILIHSSLRRTLEKYSSKYGFKITPDIILESFIEAVGEKGTLLFPLFNFDYTEGITFNIKNTPSQMGILSETARKHPKVVRTGHPIYSFAVIGNKIGRFKNLTNYSGYGSDSPFRILYELGGKIAILDLEDQNSQTFYHHIEEMNIISYRFHKKFTSKYIDEEGIETTRTFGLYVRDLEEGVLTYVNPMGELLWENSLYKGDRPKEKTGLRIINARDMFHFVSKYIKEGKAKDLLYRIDGET